MHPSTKQVEGQQKKGSRVSEASLGSHFEVFSTEPPPRDDMQRLDLSSWRPSQPANFLDLSNTRNTGQAIEQGGPEWVCSACSRVNRKFASICEACLASRTATPPRTLAMPANSTLISTSSSSSSSSSYSSLPTSSPSPCPPNLPPLPLPSIPASKSTLVQPNLLHRPGSSPSPFHRPIGSPSSSSSSASSSLLGPAPFSSPSQGIPKGTVPSAYSRTHPHHYPDQPLYQQQSASILNQSRQSHPRLTPSASSLTLPTSGMRHHASPSFSHGLRLSPSGPSSGLPYPLSTLPYTENPTSTSMYHQDHAVRGAGTEPTGGYSTATRGERLPEQKRRREDINYNSDEEEYNTQRFPHHQHTQLHPPPQHQGQPSLPPQFKPHLQDRQVQPPEVNKRYPPQQGGQSTLPYPSHTQTHSHDIHTDTYDKQREPHLNDLLSTPPWSLAPRVGLGGNTLNSKPYHHHRDEPLPPIPDPSLHQYQSHYPSHDSPFIRISTSTNSSMSINSTSNPNFTNTNNGGAVILSGGMVSQPITSRSVSSFPTPIPSVSSSSSSSSSSSLPSRPQLRGLLPPSTLLTQPSNRPQPPTPDHSPYRKLSSVDPKQSLPRDTHSPFSLPPQLHPSSHQPPPQSSYRLSRPNPNISCSSPLQVAPSSSERTTITSPDPTTNRTSLGRAQYSGGSLAMPPNDESQSPIPAPVDLKGGLRSSNTSRYHINNNNSSTYMEDNRRTFTTSTGESGGNRGSRSATSKAFLNTKDRQTMFGVFLQTNPDMEMFGEDTGDTGGEGEGRVRRGVKGGGPRDEETEEPLGNEGGYDNSFVAADMLRSSAGGRGRLGRERQGYRALLDESLSMGITSQRRQGRPTGRSRGRPRGGRGINVKDGASEGGRRGQRGRRKSDSKRGPKGRDKARGSGERGRREDEHDEEEEEKEVGEDEEDEEDEEEAREHDARNADDDLGEMGDEYAWEVISLLKERALEQMMATRLGREVHLPPLDVALRETREKVMRQTQAIGPSVTSSNKHRDLLHKIAMGYKTSVVDMEEQVDKNKTTIIALQEATKGVIRSENALFKEALNAFIIANQGKKPSEQLKNEVGAPPPIVPPPPPPMLSLDPSVLLPYVPPIISDPYYDPSTYLAAAQSRGWSLPRWATERAPISHPTASTKPHTPTDIIMAAIPPVLKGLLGMLVAVGARKLEVEKRRLWNRGGGDPRWMGDDISVGSSNFGSPNSTVGSSDSTVGQQTEKADKATERAVRGIVAAWARVKRLMPGRGVGRLMRVLASGRDIMAVRKASMEMLDTKGGTVQQTVVSEECESCGEALCICYLLYNEDDETVQEQYMLAQEEGNDLSEGGEGYQGGDWTSDDVTDEDDVLGARVGNEGNENVEEWMYISELSRYFPQEGKDITEWDGPEDKASSHWGINASLFPLPERALLVKLKLDQLWDGLNGLGPIPEPTDDNDMALILQAEKGKGEMRDDQQSERLTTEENITTSDQSTQPYLKTPAPNQFGSPSKSMSSRRSTSPLPSKPDCLGSDVPSNETEHQLISPARRRKEQVQQSAKGRLRTSSARVLSRRKQLETLYARIKHFLRVMLVKAYWKAIHGIHPSPHTYTYTEMTDYPDATITTTTSGTSSQIDSSIHHHLDTQVDATALYTRAFQHLNPILAGPHLMASPKYEAKEWLDVTNAFQHECCVCDSAQRDAAHTRHVYMGEDDNDEIRDTDYCVDSGLFAETLALFMKEADIEIGMTEASLNNKKMSDTEDVNQHQSTGANIVVTRHIPSALAAPSTLLPLSYYETMSTAYLERKLELTQDQDPRQFTAMPEIPRVSPGLGRVDMGVPQGEPPLLAPPPPIPIGWVQDIRTRKTDRDLRRAKLGLCLLVDEGWLSPTDAALTKVKDLLSSDANDVVDVTREWKRLTQGVSYNTPCPIKVCPPLERPIPGDAIAIASDLISCALEGVELNDLPLPSSILVLRPKVAKEKSDDEDMPVTPQPQQGVRRSINKRLPKRDMDETSDDSVDEDDNCTPKPPSRRMPSQVTRRRSERLRQAQTSDNDSNSDEESHEEERRQAKRQRIGKQNSKGDKVEVDGEEEKGAEEISAPQNDVIEEQELALLKPYQPWLAELRRVMRPGALSGTLAKRAEGMGPGWHRVTEDVAASTAEGDGNGEASKSLSVTAGSRLGRSERSAGRSRGIRGDNNRSNVRTSALIKNSIVMISSKPGEPPLPAYIPWERRGEFGDTTQAWYERLRPFPEDVATKVANDIIEEAKQVHQRLILRPTEDPPSQLLDQVKREIEQVEEKARSTTAPSTTTTLVERTPLAVSSTPMPPPPVPSEAPSVQQGKKRQATEKGKQKKTGGSSKRRSNSKQQRAASKAKEKQATHEGSDND